MSRDTRSTALPDVDHDLVFVEEFDALYVSQPLAMLGPGELICVNVSI